MHTTDPLSSTVVLLAAGVIGLALARFARISPIVGFFVIGAAIGPQALGLIDHSPTIHFLGELGVSFLLFDIGIHLSVQELRKGWRGFVISGVLQFALCTAALTLLGVWFGLAWLSAAALAAILSLSSTALVLKILAEHREESSPVGKRATEILVFQDIAAILLLVLLSGDLSRGISAEALVLPLVKMFGAAVLVIFMGRLLLKPLFRILIALKSDELITAFALLLVFLASWGTQTLGLSQALGAFLGGLALSESSYSYLVRGEIAPFRSLLLSLFFLSVGIGLDLDSIGANFGVLFGLLMAFSGFKIGANLLALRLAGIERGLATYLSFLLAQGSEFAFVLIATALSGGLIEAQSASLCVSLVGLSLAVTPLWSALGCRFSRSVCHVGGETDATALDPKEVIIVRIDEFGRQLASLLESERIPYRAHDQDLERLAYAKSRGLNVFYSDLNRPRTLGRVSLGKVLAVVSLVEDDYVLMQLIEGLRNVGGAVPVLAATESPARLEVLATLQVENVFIKNENSLVALFEALIRALGMEEQRIEAAVTRALEQLEPGKFFPQIGDGEAVQPQSFAA